MELYFEGLIIGAFTFLIIGLFHPIVIKTEYYFGVKPWWIFLLGGLAALAAAMLVEAFWSIKELFEQRQRVLKGWFPKNPKRKY